MIEFDMKNSNERSWDNLIVPETACKEDLAGLAAERTPPPLAPVVIDKKDFDVRKLKVHEDMSQETNCYSAEIWRNGKKVAYASNEGHGGPDGFHPAYPDSVSYKEDETPAEKKKREKIMSECRERFDELEAWVKNLPPQSSYSDIYSAVAAGDGMFWDTDVEDFEKGWRFSCTAMDLETLMHLFISRKAYRQIVSRRLSRMFCLGPEDAGEPCRVATFKEKLTEVHRSIAGSKYGWIVPYKDFLEVPIHYYPAPHKFASRLMREDVIAKKDAQEIEESTVLPTHCIGQAAWETNDNEVVIKYGEGDNSSKRKFSPDEVMFLREVATATV